MRRLLGALFTLGAIILGSTAAEAADFYPCYPNQIAVFAGRIHVRCTTSAQDGGDTIWYWAVPTSDAQGANRFLSTATTALVTGRPLKFSYDPGDTSGTAFNCLASDCRFPWATTLY